jgi:hypothetical protein
MNLIRLALCILIMFGVSNCATMNKSECRQADWQIIGLEDGSKGRAISYIGNRREACAEHGVKPDLAQYNIGREAGLRQYCTHRNGFSRGRSGYSYNDACQGEQRGAYREGYDRGRELYGLLASLKKEIDYMHKDLHEKKEQLVDLEKRIQRVESKLVLKEGSIEQRRKQLHRYNHLQADYGALDHDIHDLELYLTGKQDEYKSLKSQQSY